MCESCDICDTATHFRKTACTETEQTQCQALTVCGSEQFQTRVPSLTQDRLCQDATQCVAGQEEVNTLTATSDRSCQLCPAGMTDADSNPATECVACGAGHFVPEGSTGSCDDLKCIAGYTDADSDPATPCVACDGTSEYTSTAGHVGACNAMKACRAGEEVAADGSISKDRVCRVCAPSWYSLTTNGVSEKTIQPT